MSEENIRKRVVASFRKAIDLEQKSYDLEAYRNYLDGLALVAAALQQDADSSWSLSEKERRSLVGFAKQSVDRILFLLDKQDDVCGNIFKGTTSMPSHVESTVHPTAPPAKMEVARVELHQEHDESPIARMRSENKWIIARYAGRLEAAASKAERHNLQLELERRLTENATIARQQQTLWEQQRSQVAAWCQRTAEHKFKIREKLETGKITEADFKKQRVYAAALQYEEENAWLKSLKQARDETRQREMVNHVLHDKLHPLGSLMCQMQYGILDKVMPIIKHHQENIPSLLSNGNVEEARSVASIDSGLGRLALQPPARMQDEITKEQEEALIRHFHNIADDIKQDIKLLETLLTALFEPLNTENGASIITELLHECYFAPIKPNLILLLRLGLRRVETDLAGAMAGNGESGSVELVEMDDSIKRSASAGLVRLVSLHSPCQMLDSLVATLRLLATAADDNGSKSIGADDLLPRLLMVVLASGLPSLVAEAAFMESFMPVGRALGEAGYCLTVLQSVMTCAQLHTG